jgi:hypothetical protein
MLKMYPLSEAANPMPTRFVDGRPVPLHTLPFYDVRALQDIHDIVRRSGSWLVFTQTQQKLRICPLKGVTFATDDGGHRQLLQLRMLHLGFSQNGDVGVGVLQRVRRSSRAAVALQHVSVHRSFIWSQRVGNHFCLRGQKSA